MIDECRADSESFCIFLASRLLVSKLRSSRFSGGKIAMRLYFIGPFCHHCTGWGGFAFFCD